MRIQKVSQAWYGMIMSGGLVLLLAILMLCPIVPDGASAKVDPECAMNPGSALCCELQPSHSSCTGSSTGGSTTAEPSISLALAARTEINIVPVPKGEFNAGTASLKVAVNNATSQEVEGYKIYLKTETSNNSLTGATLTDRSIQSITANTTKASFPNNTWGYSLNRVGTATADTATYSPVPTTSTIIDDSTLLAGDYDLIFATKVDTATAPDQYSTALVVSAIAEPKVVTTLSSITNMQEMTSAICAASSENETKQLIDTRDNKSYWVAKLKDGNCWMTQNLALDITTAGLKASDTDIESDWNSSSAYPPKATEYAVPTSGDTSQTNTLSWNLSGQGKNQWVLGTPTKTTSCGDVTDISTCTKVGFVKIDDTWSPTFQAQNGTWTGTGDYAGQTTYIAADPANKTYDPHYLIGNYYQWNTATAGTGGTITNQDAEGSVCPKGWELPSSGDSAASPSTTKNTFARLLSKYGVASSLTGTVDGVNYNIAEAPLYFVRSGFVYIGNSKLWYPGQDGYNWSSMSNSSANYAYYLDFSNSGVYPSYYNGRWNGCSLRCMAE